MPPETRAFVSNSTYLSNLRNAYQYQYYIPEAIEHYYRIDYPEYQIKFDFFKKPKKALEIE